MPAAKVIVWQSASTLLGLVKEVLLAARTGSEGGRGSLSESCDAACVVCAPKQRPPSCDWGALLCVLPCRKVGSGTHCS